MDDTTLDRTLRALSDATRRALLDRLRERPGLTLTELTEGLPQTRQSLSKHLALLEDAELVVPVWRGREKRHFLNPAPLRALPARWGAGGSGADGDALSALREAVGAVARAADPAAPVPVTRPARGAADAVALALRGEPSPLLQGQPVTNAAALDAARNYLAQTAHAVRALKAALAPDAGYDAPAGGGFSLAEHLWHLADIETLGWRCRFERILDETTPTLAGVDGDRLAIERRYRERPWRGAAVCFLADRRRSLAALVRFDTEVLKCPVRFAGTRTRAGAVLAAAVAHDLEHRTAMAELWLRQPKKGRSR
jgi:DNA-binding transcriptional ArsR family regulator